MGRRYAFSWSRVPSGDAFDDWSYVAVDGAVSTRVRHVGVVLALVALAVSALYGGDFFDLRTRLLGSETPAPRLPAASRTADEPVTVAGEETRVRSSPWWQDVEQIAGDGSATETVTIDERALQWRVAWTCERGSLEVNSSTDEEPLADASCPAEDVAYGVQAGQITLEVVADGPWELAVEQQVDVPLEEPPLPAMAAADTVQVATGSFYDLDQTGRGNLVIYRFADGGQALRLEDFFVTPNVDLEIHLSPLEAPKTTEEFLSTPSETVADLPITAGSMNFTLPDTIDPAAYRSVVIWCPPLNTAYAAATLVEPR